MGDFCGEDSTPQRGVENIEKLALFQLQDDEETQRRSLSSSTVSLAENSVVRLEEDEEVEHPDTCSGAFSMSASFEFGAMNGTWNACSQWKQEEDTEEEEEGESWLEEREEAVGLVKEKFLERCALLYHDILDACEQASSTADDTDGRQSTVQALSGRCSNEGEEQVILSSRHEKLSKQASLMEEHFPQASCEILYRMQMIDSAMKHLRQANTTALRHHDSCGSSADEQGGCNSNSPWSAMKVWLKGMDERLHDLEKADIEAMGADAISSHYIPLQTSFQEEVQKSGPVYLSQIELTEHRKQEAEQKGRRDLLVRSLRSRWHAIWLRSLEVRCRLDQQLEQGVGRIEYADWETIAPTPKRRRVKSPNLSLDKEEMEKILKEKELQEFEFLEKCCKSQTEEELEGNEIHETSEKIGAEEEDISLEMPRDVGYSSGENSFHEAADVSLVADKTPESEISIFVSNHESTPKVDDGLEKDKRLPISPVLVDENNEELYDEFVSTIKFASKKSDVREEESAEIGDKREIRRVKKGDFSGVDLLTQSMVVNVGDVTPSRTEDNMDQTEELLSGNRLEKTDMSSSGFGEELERLIKQGTIWRELIDSKVDSLQRVYSKRKSADLELSGVRKQQQAESCDASSEQSECEQQQRQRETEKSNGTSKSCLSQLPSSLKRQHSQFRRRIRPTSLSGSIRLLSNSIHQDLPTPARKSDVMEMCRKTFPKGASKSTLRRKLKAKRFMPRSISDGEHINRAPKEESGSYAEGEEGEQSETAVWQWDDYKPPAHNEGGPVEDLRLDSTRLTHFGDDYLQFLRRSLGQSPTEVLVFMLLLYTLTHGLSSESESGHVAESTGELSDLLCESQLQLARVKESLNNCDDAVENLVLDFLPLSVTLVQDELLAACQKNVQMLQRICGQLLAKGGRQSAVSQEEYALLTALLKEWQDLLFVLHNGAKCGEKIGQKKNCARDVLQSEIERFGQSLKVLLDEHCFGFGKPNGANFHTMGSRRNMGFDKLADVNSALDTFRELEVRLQEEQSRLSVLASTLGISAEDSESEEEQMLQNEQLENDQIRGELQLLRKYCEGALKSCSAQISQLTQLRESWQEWDETVTVLKRLMAEFEAKLANIELSGQISSTDANESSTTNCAANQADFRLLYSAMQQCSDRLTRLELLCDSLMRTFDASITTSSACNSAPTTLLHCVSGGADSGCYSSSSSSLCHSPIPQFRSQLLSCTSQMALLKERFHDLPEAAGFCEEQTPKLLSTDTTTNEEMPMGENGLDHEDQVESNVNAGISVVPSSQSGGGLWCRLVSLGRKWLFGGGVVLLVLLGVAWLHRCLHSHSLSLQQEEETNNWKWAWGPQLDYVNGPPPV